MLCVDDRNDETHRHKRDAQVNIFNEIRDSGFQQGNYFQVFLGQNVL